MPTDYRIAQLALPSRLFRFVRRTRSIPGAPPTTPLTITSRFPAQALQVGEQRIVAALFLGNTLWRAVSATFTLLANGNPLSGYQSLAAVLLPDSSGHITTATALLNAVPTAEPNLPPGTYTGLFTLTDSNSDIYLAEGTVTVQPILPTSPLEVTLSGGEG